MYVVTGVDINGRRFKAIRTRNYWHAYGINVFRGTVWEENEETGKRKLLWRVWN